MQVLWPPWSLLLVLLMHGLAWVQSISLLHVTTLCLIVELAGYLLSCLQSRLQPVAPSKEGFAVVTGASAGIGREIARLLAGRGWNLLLVARREARLRDLAQELSEGNPGIVVKCLALDVSSAPGPAILRAVKESAKGAFVEVLVHAAGAAHRGWFLEQSEDKLHGKAGRDWIS